EGQTSFAFSKVVRVRGILSSAEEIVEGTARIPLIRPAGTAGRHQPSCKLIPGSQNLRYPLPIHPRTDGLQTTVAGWAFAGFVSQTRSGLAASRRAIKEAQ